MLDLDSLGCCHDDIAIGVTPVREDLAQGVLGGHVNFVVGLDHLARPCGLFERSWGGATAGALRCCPDERAAAHDRDGGNNDRQAQADEDK